MGIEDILEKKMPEAIRYASNILSDTHDFIEFAVALTDYMGKDFIPYCKSVYKILRNLPHSVDIQLAMDEELSAYTPEVIESEYNIFLYKQKQKRREQEFKENIDELQFLVQNYRNSEEFQKMLDFIAHFRYLAPYNAMLVQMQKPGATFVFTGKKWQEYGRRPKVNGQKLIILKPFGPIQCVFDFSDTEPIPNVSKIFDESELMKLWDQGLLLTRGDIPNSVWNTLINNLPMYGIYLDDSFRAANSYGGYIMPYKKQPLLLRLNRKNVVKVNSRFVISINESLDRAAKFHAICHELGHLFCYHLSYNESKKRILTIKEKEFEAETVAWLVCKRLGVYNPSEKYLASYAPHGEIPICSTDMIMKAVAEIEKMLYTPIKIRESLWYKEDKELKEKIRNIEKRLKSTDLFNNKY